MFDSEHEVFKDRQRLSRDHWLNSSMLLNSMSKYTIGRNMCVTEKGYLGRVPMGSKVGDIICILFGGGVPFALRESGEGYYRFIGECYVHGIMDGEAVEGRDLEGFARDFEIH